MESHISATDLARRLGDILGRIRYRGESFIVERNGKPVARIGPVAARARRDVPQLGSEVAEVMRRRGVVRAGVFGSAARGETHTDSDVDFLVEFEEGRTLLDLSGLCLDLVAVLGRNVDVATPNSLHPVLEDQIMRDLVPIL